MSRPWTIVVLPDTQVYAKARPDLFEAQIRYILAERERRDIRLVLHEGDVVDDPTGGQWEVMARQLRRLDGAVPYLVAPGNHDLGPRGCASDRSTKLGAFLTAEACGAAGTFAPAAPENAWCLIPGDRGPWLAFALELAPRAAVVAWAREVLDAHRDATAVVVTHAFLYSDGTRYDREQRPDQKWRPCLYGLAKGEDADAHDGEALYRALIEPCPQVRLVLSGHVLTERGVAHRTDVRAGGTPVHQLLTNFQTWPNGGDGWLRLIEVCEGEGLLRVRTYSPVRDQYLVGEGHQLDLGM